jgi:hypothetical protein
MSAKNSDERSNYRINGTQLLGSTLFVVLFILGCSMDQIELAKIAVEREDFYDSRAA